MKKILFTILSVLIYAFSFAQDDIPVRPDPPTLVTDYANVFSSEEKSSLENKLVNFFASTSTQIAVVTVDNLNGYNVSDYAFRLGEKWGIGSEKFDNGILVLLKPKTSDSRGEVFIAIGYGLEGVVPDATAKRIVEKEMIPMFKENNMYGGIVKATDVLIDITKGEYNYKQYEKLSGGKSSGGMVVVIILIIAFYMIFGGKKGGVYSRGGRSSSLPFWIALGMLSGNKNNHGGFFDSFSSGSGGFSGGSSFGGFGGFGGGSFGGGGAGGSW